MSPTLRSHWIFVYSGETAGIATRKIERCLQRKLLDPRIRDDWPHGDERRPMIEAFVPSEGVRWEDALRDTLSVARRFTPSWKIDLYDANSDILGRSAEEGGDGRLSDGPACLLRIFWRLRLDQEYVRF
ncbi:MAG: hypothetical protein ACOY82_11690 [Pseudomonadota bacterium]